MEVLLNIDLFDIGLSLGVFASVTMLVVAIFSQGGTVQVSAQRQAAIATGHSDRKTLFENPYLRPMMWMLLSICHRLAAPRFKQWIGRALMTSGNPNYHTPEEYLAISLFNGLMLGVVLELLSLLTTGQFGVMPVIIGIVFGAMLTLWQLYSRASTRLRTIAKRVPYSLDLLSLAMGAGATFTEAVRTVAREGPTDPFNVELNALLTEMDLGSTRRRALENLAERIPIDSLKSIVASAIQAEELGTPLSEVLHAQASLMRLQRSVRAEEAAAVASVRILVPSLLILMGVVLMLFAPSIISFIRKGGLF